MTPTEKQQSLDILTRRYGEQKAQVTDDLYNLGLTARKQAIKTEDPGKVDDDDPMKKFYQDAKK